MTYAVFPNTIDQPKKCHLFTVIIIVYLSDDYSVYLNTVLLKKGGVTCTVYISG